MNSEEAMARIRRMESALKFYADPGDYKAPFTGGMGKLWKDCGPTARLALQDAIPCDEIISNAVYSPYKNGRFVP